MNQLGAIWIGNTVEHLLELSPLSKNVMPQSAGLSVWSLCLFFLWMCEFSLGTPSKDQNIKVKFIGNSKLSLGVSMSVNDCLCLALWWTCNLITIYPASSSDTSWPTTQKVKKKEEMDLSIKIHKHFQDHTWIYSVCLHCKSLS